MLIENVLMMIVGVSLLTYTFGYIRDNQVIADLIGGPWVKLSGMIESGVLAEPAAAKGRHANQFDRKSSYDPQSSP